MGSEITTLTTQELIELRDQLDSVMCRDDIPDAEWVSAFLLWCDCKTELDNRNHHDPLPQPRAAWSQP